MEKQKPSSEQEGNENSASELPNSVDVPITKELVKKFCFYCFHILTTFLKNGQIAPFPSEFPNFNSSLFVTWHINMNSKAELEKQNQQSKTEEDDEDELRGCIGTFASAELSNNLPLYTIYSAFKDSRFPPISSKEVPFLKCGVSLLHNFEGIDDIYGWEVGKHGVQIDFTYKHKKYSGTFLPEVAIEQKWDQKKTMNHLLRKAGFDGSMNKVKDKIKCQVYQSTKSRATFAEYLDFLAKNDSFFQDPLSSDEESQEKADPEK